MTSDTQYYVEAYTMSVTEFAKQVSGITGRTITASETSYADRQKDLDRFGNLEHI